MDYGASKSAARILLILNLVLYLLVIIISGWAIYHGIDRGRETASFLSSPSRIFPIYFPIGNKATGFFAVFSLIAGLVGFITSLTGVSHVIQWNAPNLQAAAASSLITWSLTLLAMGLAWKEIHLGSTDSNLRALETIMILVTGTQLFCIGAIHAGVEYVYAVP
ncbi:membrane protein PM19L-like [Diospyros lotus]|uniref:membrane protein PM19L-like n=1 Tax=Diospyros lotus TaxID=55363 RepID=UPI002250A067|nr:membrane protein PM19L-like [Diospyros lotus]